MTTNVHSRDRTPGGCRRCRLSLLWPLRPRPPHHFREPSATGPAKESISPQGNRICRVPFSTSQIPTSRNTSQCPPLSLAYPTPYPDLVAPKLLPSPTVQLSYLTKTSFGHGS